MTVGPVDTKAQFKLHLESQSLRKTGKATLYVRAWDLLSKMLAAVPEWFADWAPREFEQTVTEWGQSAGREVGTFWVESWIEWSRNFQPYGLGVSAYFEGE